MQSAKDAATNRRARRKRVVGGSKLFGDLFLEYHFGWEPLVKDIGGAVDLLQKPYPRGKVTGRGSSDKGSGIVHTQVGNEVAHDDYKIINKVRIQAEVSVSNQNLFLASQMGFVNPLSVAWELVPFSFVVDWFTNVGQVLGSMTDFVGVSLGDTMITYKQETIRDWIRFNTVSGVVRGNTAKGVFVRRTLPGVIPGPSLVLKPFKGFSVTRGLTAISLLLQQLRK
jgi:hypothetical protein